MTRDPTFLLKNHWPRFSEQAELLGIPTRASPHCQKEPLPCPLGCVTAFILWPGLLAPSHVPRAPCGIWPTVPGQAPGGTPSLAGEGPLGAVGWKARASGTVTAVGQRSERGQAMPCVARVVTQAIPPRWTSFFWS